MKAIVMVFLGVLSLAVNVSAYAGSDWVCTGRVAGVGERYNPATGSGFLALRAGPNAQATQLGELFNGDRVAIAGRSGQWLNVITARQERGWVFAKYIKSSCK